MEFPQALSRHLSALTDALDDPGTDLQAVLAVLADDLTVAVPSFLGLTMSLHLDGAPITLTAITPAAAATARATLHLPLEPLAPAGPGSSVVFFAGGAGAFVDLAADTRHAYSLDGQVVLDGHFFPVAGSPGPPGVGGLDEATATNRAIGVLIDRGYLPDEARERLLSRAADHSHGLLGAAEDLLRIPNQ